MSALRFIMVRAHSALNGARHHDVKPRCERPGAQRTARMRFFLAIISILILVLGRTAQPASAATTAAQSFAAVQTQAKPKFDATLSDPAWGKAVTASEFFNLTTRRPAKLATTAYLLYDDKNLYVAFRCDQDGVPIHAEQTTNNIGFGQDDFVGVGIDTSGAGSQVYFFETTPRAVRYQQASESARYAPPWEAQAAVTGSTWTAMLTIPLADLRAAGGSPRTWRFNFIRGVAGVAEHYTWAYDGLMQDGQPPNWPGFSDARFWPALTGIVLASAAARPRPRAEIYGLESIGRDRKLFAQPNNTFATENVRNYGLDVTYPLTNTIAAVGTLNPDFSNVEVDQQTIVPQVFPRNLTEYRPFFAQGAAYFTNQSVVLGSQLSAPDEIFYSPSIGTFDRGLKVEGTYGLQQFGLLSVRATQPGAVLDDQAFGFKHALTDRTFLYWVYGVLAHHDIGNDSTVETGLAGRNLQSGFVWGYDQALEQRRLTTDPSHVFSYARSGFVDVHKPNYEVYTGYVDVAPNYGPLDGFTNVNDLRGPQVSTNFTTSFRGIKTWTGYFGVDRFLTHSGSVKQADFLGMTDIFTNNLFHLNLTQSTTSLDDPFLTGGRRLPFNQSSVTLGYKDGTPSPTDFTYSAGPFSTFYLQLFNVTATRSVGSRFNVQGMYAGSHERSPSMGVNGQILRSIAVGESLGTDSNITLALRTINGTGGFAQPGLNFAGSFHTRFANGNELFVNYGSPAAPVSLDRLIIKYVLRLGGAAGT
jgi:hypothetical protein